MTKKIKSLAKRSLYGTSILSFAICLLLMLAFYAYFRRSTAWFSQNKKVDSSGMTVEVDPEASLMLVIPADDPSGETKYVTEINTPLGEDTQLSPATLNDSKVLVYPDISKVTASTGMFTGTAYNEAEEGTHYIQTTVYLVTICHDLSFTSLTASLSSFDSSVIEAYSFMKSGSVDILVGDTYVDTLCFEDADATVTLKQDGSDITGITTGSPIKVTLRFYFDGALGDGTKTYIRSSTVTTDDLNFGVSFTAVNPETAG